MTTGKELARSEDLRRAKDEIVEYLRRGAGQAAQTAMVVYAPGTQALIVRAAFVDEIKREPGESRVDAVHRAGRVAERVLETVPTENATAVVGALDHSVVGAMISAAAGEPSSTAAHLIDPERIEDLLASDLELWTEERFDPDQPPASGGRRRRSINVPHLVHTLWTILQTDEDRAHAFLNKLNLDLVAYPLALEILRLSFQEELEEGLGEELADDTPADGSLDGSFTDLCVAAMKEGPDSLGLRYSELVQLLEEIYQFSPETFHAIVRRAQEMDPRMVHEQLIAEAADRASGGEAPVAAIGEDDMFKPLDPPKGG